MTSKEKQQVPSIGRIVHYILPDGDHRAAVIVYVAEPAAPETPVNLWVFLDKLDAVSIAEQQPSAVVQGTGPGTWHWPEYVPAVEAPTEATS